MKKLFTICSYGGGYFLPDQSRKEERTGLSVPPTPPKGGQRRSDYQTRLSEHGGGLRG